MIQSRFLRLFAVALLILPYASAFAQTPAEMKSVVDGTALPNKLKPQDLTDEYWPVNLTLGGGSPFDMMTMGMRFAVMGESSAENSQLGLYRAIQVSWTKGQMVQVGDTRFLATYRLDVDPSTFSPDSRMERLLSLVLVKPDAITMIGAVPDYTKEQFMLALGVRSGDGTQVATDKTRTMSNLKQLALGTIMYAADWDDEIPYVQSVKSLQAVVRPYLKNDELWKTYNPSGGRILMNMSVAGVNISTIERPADTPMLYDEKEWPDGTRAVAYSDGHVKMVARPEWQSMQPMLKLKLKRKSKPLPPNWDGGYPVGR